MPRPSTASHLPLPRQWKRSIQGAIVHVMALAHYVLVSTRGRAAGLSARPLRGIAPLHDPFDGPKGLQAPLQTAGALERYLERLAELEQLANGERATSEGVQDLRIAEGQQGCHGSGGQHIIRPYVRSNLFMSCEKKPFINVDELMPQVSLEEAAR